MPKLDRNQRARLIFHAERLDRDSHRKGWHGGSLKRSGLAVLKALLFTFYNLLSGRCDPSYEAIASAAGVTRSTVALALQRLEEAGLLARTRRQQGTVRRSNLYAFCFVRFSGANHQPIQIRTTSARSVPLFQALGLPDESHAETRAYLRAAEALFARRRSGGAGERGG